MAAKKCSDCWWQEGGRCYNESIATIAITDGVRRGQLIDDALLRVCDEGNCHRNKRKFLERLIPPDKLTIVSEHMGDS